MTDADSTPPPDRKARRKPHPDFPLFPHANGQWCKKIRGKAFYFGKDSQQALELWLLQKDDLLAGRTPRITRGDELKLIDLCNLFLESRESKVRTKELSQRSWDEYKIECGRLLGHFNKQMPVEALRPEDFRVFRELLAQGVGLKTLEGRISRIRAVFNYAIKNGLIDVNLALLLGDEFEKPTKAALARERGDDERMFEADEIRSILSVCKSRQMRAMILLAIQSGLGNTDLCSIEVGDIKDGWLTKRRQKTGKRRRIPLWAETQEAIDAVIAKRTKPTDDAHSDLVFITKYGAPFAADVIAKEFAKLRKEAGLKRGTFYQLRHTFQTIGDESQDFVAVSRLMGHIDSSISSHYRQRISDERLLKVVNHVRNWLFGGGK